MKKLLFLFLVVTAFVGCSSDDNKNEEVLTKDSLKKELLLKVENNRITVGDELVFTAVDGKGNVVDAAFYVEGKQVKNPVRFDELGVFSVVAKMKGFKDSNVLMVYVDELIGEETPNDKPNFFTFNGEDVDFEIVMLATIRESVMQNGKSIMVDQVVELEDGRLANVFELIPAGEQVAAYLTFYVVNESIVKKDGVIVDYGKRVLLNKDSEIVFEDFSMIGEFNSDVSKLSVKSFELVFDKLVVKNDGANGDIDVSFSLVNNVDELKFGYNGNVIFKEF